MDKVERIGTGIKRMRDAVKSTGLPYPKIKSDMFFTITFERPPYSLRGTKKVTEKVTIKVTEKVTENQETILAQMKANPHITSKELSDIIGISDRKIKENIKKLKANKLLKRIGSAKGGHWQVVEK
jgi:ATP-dependent DNA helicase RecG